MKSILLNYYSLKILQFFQADAEVEATFKTNGLKFSILERLRIRIFLL
jgi:hypothetical protein